MSLSSGLQMMRMHAENSEQDFENLFVKRERLKGNH